MPSNEEIRNELLKLLPSAEESESLSKQLDNLLIISEEGKVHVDSFFTDLNNIIAWHEIDSLKQRSQIDRSDSSISKILNVLSWAKKVWLGELENGSVNRIFVSFLVFERLFLNPNIDFEKYDLKQKAKERISKVYLGSNLISDISPGIQSNYSDNKAIRDYKDAAARMNFSGLFDFFTLADNGYHRNDFLQVLAQTGFRLMPDLVISEIEKYNPITQYFMIKSIGNKYIVQMLSTYSGKSPLPLMIGLNRLIKNLQWNNEIIEEEEWLTSLSPVLRTLLEYGEKNTSFSQLQSVIRIGNTAAWVQLKFYFLGNNPDYCTRVLGSIDFNDGNGELAFGIISKLDSKIAYDISKQVYTRYFQSLSKLSFYQRSFFNFNLTSYHGFLLCYITNSELDTFVEFSMELEKRSIALKRAIHSWNYANVQMHFSVWIYWILTVNLFDKGEKKYSSLHPVTKELLSDDRILNRVSCLIRNEKIDFSCLKNFSEFIELSKIRLPYGYGDQVVDFKWFKNTT